jgi:hypothetical protein
VCLAKQLRPSLIRLVKMTNLKKCLKSSIFAKITPN